MNVITAATHKAEHGSADSFTGDVWNESLAVGEGPSQIHVARVTFSPAARTRWHTHPRGQILFAMSGVGRVQKNGEPVRELFPGDTVTIAPDELHWHGAAPDQVFVHLAMQEPGPDDEQAEWLRPVTDEEYLQATAKSSSQKTGR